MKHEVASTEGPKGSDALGMFFSRFMKSPLTVGSPLASSERLVRRLLAPLPWPNLKTVVELGAGTGSFTKFALNQLAPDARIIALDNDPAFTQALRQTLTDARLDVVTGSAEDLRKLLMERGVARADCIISGVPFSTLEEADADCILAETKMLLGEHGIFAAYQVRSVLGDKLKIHFAKVRASYEWRHIPPCHLYWASQK